MWKETIKYPRKLKKAIKQLRPKKRSHGTGLSKCICFGVLSNCLKTKWLRKARPIVLKMEYKKFSDFMFFELSSIVTQAKPVRSLVDDLSYEWTLINKNNETFN